MTFFHNSHKLKYLQMFSNIFSQNNALHERTIFVYVSNNASKKYSEFRKNMTIGEDVKVVKGQTPIKKCERYGSSKSDEKKSTKQKSLVKVTLIEGEGESLILTSAVQQTFCAAKVPVEFEIVPRSDSEKVNPEILNSFRKNKVGIVGPQFNLKWLKELRKELNLFARVSICRKMEGYSSPYDDVDCVIIRDQTEGEYSGIEYKVVKGVMQTIKVSTTDAANRLAGYVFKYASENNRKTITVAHKANIMHLTDGNFLKAMRKEAAKHTESHKFEERYLDTVCLNLLTRPSFSDVLVSSSMYGDILSVVATSMIGGSSLCASLNAGPNVLLYDTKHTLDKCAVDEYASNPTGILLSAIIMLRGLKLNKFADKIYCALKDVHKTGEFQTKDIGGDTSCSEFVDAVCNGIKSQNT